MTEEASRQRNRRVRLSVLAGVAVALLCGGGWLWRDYFPDHFFLDHSNVYYDVASLVQVSHGSPPRFPTTKALASELTHRLQDRGPDFVAGLANKPEIVAWGNFIQHRRLRKELEALEER